MSDTALNLYERYLTPKDLPSAPKPPHRPRTRTPEHYAALLEAHRVISEWFVERFGRRHRSDAELLKAHFADEYMKRGLRPSRADDPTTGRKLKTLLNELSLARRLYPHSRKGAIYGKS